MRLVTRCAVLLAVLLVAGSGCVRRTNVEAERDEIRAADSTWAAATKAKNVDDFMQVIADDCVIMNPNAPAISGKAAVRAWITQSMAMPGFKVTWEASTIDVAASGDLGYSSGTYQFKMTMPDGTPMGDFGKYATIWKKQTDGSWKVVLDIVNSDVPVTGASDSTGAKGQE